MAAKCKINYVMLKVKGNIVKLDPDVYYRIVNTNPEFRRKFQRPLSLDKDGYISVRIGSHPTKRQSLSHFVMDAQTGQIVDHINGSPFDNRRVNLRLADFRQNKLNCKCTNATGFYGVLIKGDRGYKYYFAQFYTKQGKRLTFNTPFTDEGLLLAALAHDRFVFQNGEEDYARLNFENFKFKTFKYLLLNADLDEIKKQIKNSPPLPAVISPPKAHDRDI